MLSVEQIAQEALLLSNSQRVLLVEKLLNSLEFDIDETVQSAWIQEVKKRWQEIKSGAVQPIPGDQALAQARQMLD